MQITPSDDPADFLRYNRARIGERATFELTGLVRGMLIDGDLSELEVRRLKSWCDVYGPLIAEWPFPDLVRRLERVLADGVVTRDERRGLQLFLEEWVGEVEQDGITPTRLPLTDPPPLIDFAQRRFVLTGEFLYGVRSFCVQAVQEQGGVCEPRVTRRTDFLVIGSLGTKSWARSSYGRKILKAVEYVERGWPLRIVSEEHWSSSLC